MSASLSYPGVYINEIEKQNFSFATASTSIAAFIGRTLQGPINEPTHIQSFAEFERIFGGIWSKSKMGYAVRDFYNNGGTNALIVRVFRPTSAQANSVSYIKLMQNQNQVCIVTAANEGAWGNNLQIKIDYNVDPKGKYGLTAQQLFNLSVYDKSRGITEQFMNVSIADSPARLDYVLKNKSNLIRVKPDTLDVTKLIPEVMDWTDLVGGDDGINLTRSDILGSASQRKGIYALDKVDEFNLLCIPPYLDDDNIDYSIVPQTINYCEKRKAFYIIDSPKDWQNKTSVINAITNLIPKSSNAGIFFPRLLAPDSLKQNQITSFVPCGAIAGIFARTDSKYGIWKSAAGLNANIVGATGLTVSLTNDEIGELSSNGINCIVSNSAAGIIVWGNRTLEGTINSSSAWKYISIKRMAMYLEKSINDNVQWAVLQQNNESLWAELRLKIDSFMNNLFRQGAFQGKSSQEAYFIKCDQETTTPQDVANGVVNILVGFAPLKPAEFVVFTIQQII